MSNDKRHLAVQYLVTALDEALGSAQYADGMLGVRWDFDDSVGVEQMAMDEAEEAVALMRRAVEAWETRKKEWAL